MQCLAAILFMYIAVLAPTITIGGLFDASTDGRIGVIETLIGSCLVGVVYGLFSGQPLTILGPTGPTLVFEGLLYAFFRYL